MQIGTQSAYVEEPYSRAGCQGQGQDQLIAF